MNTVFSKLVTPFEVLTNKQMKISIMVMITITMLLWFSSGHSYIPTPAEIIGAYPGLIEQQDLIRNFLKSVVFVLKAMLYSVIISYIVAFMGLIPIFRPFCEFLRKFRFLPSAGLSFLFIKITPTLDSAAFVMMVYGITTWMIYSFVEISLSITKEDIMYARSLKLTKWQMIRELFIYGKGAEIFSAAIGVFAVSWLMLATVENMVKSNGGIGVVLAESNKYFKMEKVYAIQFLILFTGILLDYGLRKLRDIFYPYYKI